ncbi:hypothetical protein OFEAOIEE_LOCUS600 [Methylorubrum extorquens]
MTVLAPIFRDGIFPSSMYPNSVERLMPMAASASAIQYASGTNKPKLDPYRQMLIFHQLFYIFP